MLYALISILFCLFLEVAFPFFPSFIYALSKRLGEEEDP